MSKDHKKHCVAFAEYCLEEYDESIGQYSEWSRLVNLDYSAYIQIKESKNIKNKVIWAKSREDWEEKLEIREEKVADGEMIFGAISMRGLVPENEPIFVSDLKKSYDPHPKTVNSQPSYVNKK